MSISKSVGDFGEERAAIYLVEHGAGAGAELSDATG